MYLKFCYISHKNLIVILLFFCHFMIFSRKIKVCCCLTYLENEPVVGIGAEALKQLLEDLDLNQIAEELREEITNSKGQSYSSEKRTKIFN